MTADESKPALDEETTNGQTDFTTPDDDFRTPGETQNGEPDPWEVGSDPGAYTEELQAEEPHDPQAGEPDDPQAEEPDNPQAVEPDDAGAEELPQGESGDDQANAAETEEPDEPAAEELHHDESGNDQPNTAETQEDVNGKPEASAAEEENAEGQTEGQDEESEELKMVVRVKDGRASVAVWRSGADPHMETFPETDNLEDLLSKLPGMIERANSRWDESPMRPKYKPQRAPKKKKETSSRPTPAPAPTQQLDLQTETPQGGMARLF